MVKFEKIYQKVGLQIIERCHGEIKIPSGSTVSDKNYVDTLSSAEGCLARVISVTGT